MKACIILFCIIGFYFTAAIIALIIAALEEVGTPGPGVRGLSSANAAVLKLNPIIK